MIFYKISGGNKMNDKDIQNLQSVGPKKYLQKSKYAFFIPVEKNYLIYSSLNGFLANCTDDSYIKILENIIQTERIEFDENNSFLGVLLSKGILIEEGYNEKVLTDSLYEKEISQNRTLQLMLFVTLNCNFRCVYCAQKHENKIMKTEIYDRIFIFIKNSIASHQFDNVKLSFFGGEPLLRYDDIVHFLSKVMSWARENNVDVTSSMTTNGYLLTPDKFEQLIALNCNGYQITIDGTANSHNHTRILANGDQTWEQIIENLLYANSTKHKFSITVRTNYNSDVLSDLEEFYKFIGKTFDKRFSVYYETIKRQGGENDSNLDVLDDISGTIGGIKISNMLKENNIPSSNSLHRTSPANLVCYATKPNFFSIDYDGTIKKCSHHLSLPENNIGYLNENGDMIIDQKKHALWISNYSNQMKYCNDCKILPLCYGKRCVATMVRFSKSNCLPEVETLKIEQTLAAYICGPEQISNY